MQGRVTDETGRRIEGAKISVWFQGTAIADEVSGKDGSFHLRLRAGPWTYFVRVSRARAGDRDRRSAHREAGDDVSGTFRLAPENVIRGRVVGSKGEPIAGATVHALPQRRRPGRVRRGAERRRRHVRAGRPRHPALLPARVEVRLAARDAEVDGRRARQGRRLQAARAPASSRAAWSTPTAKGRRTPPWSRCCRPRSARPASPIIWRVDSDGKFAQDRFQVGTYYLWARHGEMLVYPPEKIEISDQELDAEIELQARPQGRARARAGRHHAIGRRRRARGARRAGRPLAAGAAAQGGRRDRPRRQVRGRHAAAGALRDLGPRRLAHPADHQRPARGRDPDRSRRHRRSAEHDHRAAAGRRDEPSPTSPAARKRVHRSREVA